MNFYTEVVHAKIYTRATMVSANGECFSLFSDFRDAGPRAPGPGAKPKADTYVFFPRHAPHMRI